LAACRTLVLRTKFARDWRSAAIKLLPAHFMPGGKKKKKKLKEKEEKKAAPAQPPPTGRAGSQKGSSKKQAQAQAAAAAAAAAQAEEEDEPAVLPTLMELQDLVARYRTITGVDIMTRKEGAVASAGAGAGSGSGETKEHKGGMGMGIDMGAIKAESKILAPAAAAGAGSSSAVAMDVEAGEGGAGGSLPAAQAPVFDVHSTTVQPGMMYQVEGTIFFLDQVLDPSGVPMQFLRSESGLELVDMDEVRQVRECVEKCLEWQGRARKVN
jgi:hypothetical protein